MWETEEQSTGNSEKFNQNEFTSKIMDKLQSCSYASASSFDGCYSNDSILKLYLQQDNPIKLIIRYGG